MPGGGKACGCVGGRCMWKGRRVWAGAEVTTRHPGVSMYHLRRASGMCASASASGVGGKRAPTQHYPFRGEYPDN